MRMGCVWLCLCAAWPLAGRGAERKSPGDETNITAYLEEKFGISAPPGSNDLALADGRIYRNVQVWKVEPDGVTLRHDAGLDKVDFPQLPEAWRRTYGYDPEAAAAYRQAVAAAIAEAERSQQLLREQLRTSPP